MVHTPNVVRRWRPMAALSVGLLAGVLMLAPIPAQAASPALPWDLAGDGYAELVVGARDESGALGEKHGVVTVLKGTATGPTASGARVISQESRGFSAPAKRPTASATAWPRVTSTAMGTPTSRSVHSRRSPTKHLGWPVPSARSPSSTAAGPAREPRATICSVRPPSAWPDGGVQWSAVTSTVTGTPTWWSAAPAPRPFRAHRRAYPAHHWIRDAGGVRRGHVFHRRSDPRRPGPRPPRPQALCYPVRACRCRRRAASRAAVTSGIPCS
jgi:hypothetical protein